MLTLQCPETKLFICFDHENRRKLFSKSKKFNLTAQMAQNFKFILKIWLRRPLLYLICALHSLSLSPPLLLSLWEFNESKNCSWTGYLHNMARAGNKWLYHRRAAWSKQDSTCAPHTKRKELRKLILAKISVWFIL